jgi:hypothetical protein
MGGKSYPFRPLEGDIEGRRVLRDDQSHSIVDNLVALFRHHRGWNCSGKTALAQSTIIRCTACVEFQADTRPTRSGTMIGVHGGKCQLSSDDVSVVPPRRVRFASDSPLEQAGIRVPGSATIA